MEFMYNPFLFANSTFPEGTMEKLKSALIGVGDISVLHQPGYQDHPEAELAAICDLDPDLVEQRQRQWNVPVATTDYRRLLDDPTIDIIEILTPHQTHKTLALEALAAGKHVSVQKPMSISVHEADEMIAAADASDKLFRIFENFIFYPPYIKAKELLDSGEIGRPLLIRLKLGSGTFFDRFIPLKCELWHLTESEFGRGQAVFDDGYHKWSMAAHLIGDIEAVRGWVDRSFNYIDEPSVLSWRYKDSDCLGVFDISWNPELTVRSKYFPADERIEIVGTSGRIVLTCCTGQLLDQSPLILIKNNRRYCFDDLETDWKASFVNATRHFIECVRNGGDPLLSGRRGKHLVQAAYAAALASKLGTEVRLEEVDI
jgi:predicted dehydrogenase